MNSNFNKSLLWVVMLSAISQAYPMGTAAKMVSKVGVAAAFALPSAGYAYAFGRNANIRSAFAEQTSVSTEATQNVAEIVEAPVSTEVVAEAKSIAQRAAAKVAQGKAVVINGYTSVKDFAVDKATDKEFLAQGFCGMVTLCSVSYLAHKTGVFVKIKNNWKASLIGTGVAVSALAGAAYMYPEATLNVAKSALNAIKNPYTALAAGATIAVYGVGSKLTNKYAKVGSATAVVSTAAAIGAANRFGYMDVAKNGVAYAASKVKDGAVWTAQQGYNYVAKPVYDYTVAPVVAQAVKHPYIAGGIAATVAVPAVGYGVYKGYKAWKKPAKVKRQVASTPKVVVVQQASIKNKKQPVSYNNALPDNSFRAPTGMVSNVQKVVGLNEFENNKNTLFSILDRVVQSKSFVNNDELELRKCIDYFAKAGLDLNDKIGRIIQHMNNYKKLDGVRQRSAGNSIGIIVKEIKAKLA